MDLLAAALIAGGFLALYAATACRTIYVGDSAELTAAAATLGVAHPPGYPLYTLVTGLAVRALGFLDPAHAANLMSGVYAAAAVGLTFILGRRLRFGRAASLFAAVTLAVGATFWSQAVCAEVYSLDALLCLACLNMIALSARRVAALPWLLAGLIVGSWIGHRPVNILFIPALLVLLWAVGGLGSPRRRLVIAVAGGLLSLLPFAYLPLASAADPAIDVGDPESWTRFWDVVTSAPYHRHLGGGSVELALGRLLRFVVALPREAGLGAAAAILGAGALLRRGGRDRRIGLAMLLMLGANLAFAASYNIQDINVYFLPSLIAMSLLAASGAERFLCRFGGRPRIALGVALALGALLPGLALNLRDNDLSEHRYARLFAEDLLASVPDDALLFVSGDTTIHAAWYLQAVERRSPNVVVVSLGHVNRWHFEQLRERFPGDPWPPGDAPDPRAVLSRLGRLRPTYLALSIKPDLLLRSRGRRRHATFASGVAMQVLKTGDRLNLLRRGERNLRLLQRAVKRLGPLPRDVDPDTKSIFIQYAMAAYRTGQMLQRIRRDELASAAYRLVLHFTPDRHERDIQRDVLRALDRKIPVFGWGRQARQALDNIRARTRAGGGLTGGTSPR